jgi:hypothetical protein
MATPRNSAGVNKGSQGAKNVNPLYAAVKSVTNYAGNVAREVRDIPTAISTAAQYRNSVNGGTYRNLKGDVLTQIKEVGTAAATGKKGTGASIKKSGTVQRNR